MRVYASLPLTGRARAIAGDVLRGAELAATPGVELVALDAVDPVANARRAVDDPEAVAYLGDFYSAQVHVTAPILAEADLLAVAPVATWAELGGATLVRITPDDRGLARGIARWLVDHGVEHLLLVHDHDEGYGVPVGRMCADAARNRGIAATVRPVWDHDEPMDAGDAQALLYVGVAGSGAVGLWHAFPGLWLLGTDGVAVPWLAEALEPGVAERTRFFTNRRAPWGFYGYEAMALIQDSLGPDRATTVRNARATRDRHSILGRYSLDANGLTTAPTDGRLAVVGGELVWDRSP